MSANRAAGAGGGIWNVGYTQVIGGSFVDGNSAGTSGGGIASVDNVSNLYVFESTISKNTVSGSTMPSFGGGVACEGTCIFEDAVLSGNRASTTSAFTPPGPASGGGIHTGSGASLSVTGSRIEANIASTELGFRRGGADTLGGGIYSQGPAVIVNSTISGNEAQSLGWPGGAALGGGIIQRSDPGLTGLVLWASTVGHNRVTPGSPDSVANGAGILVATGRADVRNSTVSGNVAGGNGGGIAIEEGLVRIASSTVTSNVGGSGAGSGGGLWASDDPGIAVVEIENSIVAENEAWAGANCFGSMASLGHNLADDSTCAFTANGDLVDVASGLGPLANNGGPTQTHLLDFDSRAIDAGGALSCPGTDQRGAARPVDGNFPADGIAGCDIGATELPEPGPTLMVCAGVLWILVADRKHKRPFPHRR